MKTSETIGKISEALAKAQGEMKPAAFDATNPHFRSKYATLASIMEACRSALSQNNIAVVQGTSVIEDRVIVETMLIHASGEFISDQLSMNITKDSPQAVGSAITYARRYSLSSMVGIVSDEDDDAESAMPGNGPANKTNTQPSAQKPDKPAKVADINEHKKAKEKTDQKNVKPDQTQIRIQKIRAIFTLSAKLGHTPDEMKSVIGNLVGLNRPIKESAEIKDSDLDAIITAFESELKLKEAAQGPSQQEAA